MECLRDHGQAARSVEDRTSSLLDQEEVVRNASAAPAAGAGDGAQGQRAACAEPGVELEHRCRVGKEAIAQRKRARQAAAAVGDCVPDRRSATFRRAVPGDHRACRSSHSSEAAMC